MMPYRFRKGPPEGNRCMARHPDGAFFISEETNALSFRPVFFDEKGDF